MKIRGSIIVLALIGAAAFAAIIASRHSHSDAINSAPPQPENVPSVEDAHPAMAIASETPPLISATNPIPKEIPLTNVSSENTNVATSKLERLNQIRESFHTLAAGDRLAAIRAAKQITNEVERETALLSLVTEWTHGELDPPQRRAHWIDTYGLEVGLGFEVASQPELALAWANELTDGPTRTDLLQAIARGMITSDPNAAFALNEQVRQEDRRNFFDSLLGNWALRDTAAALQWAGQLPDPTDRDTAIQSIRSVAPTGIGAAVILQDGLPIIKELVPGTPAALNGQLHPGDRLVAVSQGYSPFVDVQNLPVDNVIQMIRGAPGTLVQLQVLPADAPPNSMPRTVGIYRDQIKFKK